LRWADPPSITKPSDDPKDAGFGHETCNYRGGTQSSDAEALFVSRLVAILFNWEPGDDHVWTERPERMKARLNQIQLLGLSAVTLKGHVEYGQHFCRHQVSWGSTST
jgi:hypothetical protein